MDVSSVKKQISSGNLLDFYIFTGPEWEVQKLYIKHIAKARNQRVVRIDSILDIYGKLRNRSFMLKPVCYVIRDDVEIIQNERIQTQLDSGLLGQNTCILLLTTVDKRTKFFKQYKDRIVEFEPLKPQILAKYIKRHIDLSDSNCELLMQLCENDYGRCLLEIDKIKRYNDYLGSAKMYDGVFRKLVDGGIIYTPPKDAIFDLVHSILIGDRGQSFRLWKECEAIGESTLAILSVLYNNTRAVLQVQTCESRDISKSTGLTGWQIKCAKENLNYYTVEELLKLLKLIQEVESGIKQGNIEEQIAMPYILTNVLEW